MTAQRRRFRVRVDAANIFLLEDFILSFPFSDSALAARTLLIATELFENITEHSKGFACPYRGVTVNLTNTGDKTEMRFSYATRNFSELTGAEKKARPYFDRAAGRYRGMGLLMCRKLSASMIYKKGLFKSTIMIIL